jgi:hypothetical protein
MELAEFQRNFPPAVPVPERLQRLLEFQNRSHEWYSGYFELIGWQYGDAAWFGGDTAAAGQFVVFGHGPDGSLYAFWLYPGRTLSDAPVVFLGSEGTACGLLADNLDEFLELLATGAEELGFAVSAGDVSAPHSPAPRLSEFRRWLRESFGINAPPDPLTVVAAARSRHPDFGSWLAAWQQEHSEA